MENERQWFCEMTERYKTAMFRLTKSILGNEEDAKDAAAEAVYKAYAKLPELRSKEKFRTWLFKIAANEAYAICRKRQRTVYLEEQAQEVADPRQTVHLDNTLWSVVEMLPEDLRMVIVLFYYEALPVREISEVLDISTGAVRTRLTRARQQLRAQLMEDGRNER